VPLVFDFIEQHGLLHSLNMHNRTSLLLRADPARATELLVASHEVVPPHSVVPGLLDVIQVGPCYPAAPPPPRPRSCPLRAAALAAPACCTREAQLQGGSRRGRLWRMSLRDKRV
jgi:hypothetical protein